MRAPQGTFEAVELLVAAGGPHLVHMKNSAGDTAYDAARRGRDFRHPGPAGGPKVPLLCAHPLRSSPPPCREVLELLSNEMEEDLYSQGIFFPEAPPELHPGGYYG